MYTSQIQLAQSIIATLEGAGDFSRVDLIGSLSDGSCDKMSDIDLVLMSPERPPWDNVQLASRILKDVYGSLLHDWAGSLIPEKYLISQFMPGCDIMWWVDIGCHPDERYNDISRDDIDQDGNSHISKLLIMNAKHYIRGAEGRLRIGELYTKSTGCPPGGKGVPELFAAVRAEIDEKRLSVEFVQKMDETLQLVANKALERTRLRRATQL